tara:strand:+ start:11271 stop:11843 length:573 start_codon:yes stop_codon:yes gene_type:complete
MKPIRLAAMAATLFAAQPALAEDMSYLGRMQAVIDGRAYTTDGCDKNDPDQCGRCIASLRVVVSGSNEPLHITCTVYDDTGDAVGMTINTGHYDGVFTDTAHDDGNYGRRLDMHIALHGNALPPNVVHAETDAKKPLRDPASNFVKLAGERDAISGILEMELEVSYENALVPLGTIIPVRGSFDLAAPNG